MTTTPISRDDLRCAVEVVINEVPLFAQLGHEGQTRLIERRLAFVEKVLGRAEVERARRLHPSTPDMVPVSA